MNSIRKSVLLLVLVALVCLLAPPAYSQSPTGAITGRVTDTSGGTLPGVTVLLTSPSMIGGARTAVADVQGLYRFTLLPSGVYVVSFSLTGFTTLNIESVTLNGGSTMTINGQMTVAALEETVTVTSQTPTIDLEAANVAVNWDHRSESAEQGLCAGRQQIHAVEGLLRRDRRSYPEGQVLVLFRLSRRVFRSAHPGFHQPRWRRAGRILHEATGSDGQVDLSADNQQQAGGDGAVGSKMAALSDSRPLQPAGSDAKPGLAVAHRSVSQVARDSRSAHDVRSGPSAWRLLVA
jgi:hypothetical protein